MFFIRFRNFLLMIFGIGLLIKPMAFSESSQLTEYEIKAAFLYNFAHFVEWPEQAFSDEKSPIILGILGVSPFDNILKSAEGKPIKNRKLKVTHFDNLEDLELCHILFISQSEKENLKNVLKKLDSSSVLTVGDTGGFAQKGVIINFVTIDNKIRFEINLDAAHAANLQISSKLLNLAQITKRTGMEVEK